MSTRSSLYTCQYRVTDAEGEKLSIVPHLSSKTRSSVGGAATAMNIPFFNRLWKKEPRHALNLLAPDIVCEAHFHVLEDGSSKMYCSKLPPDMKPEGLVTIVKIMMDNVIAFAQQHGVQVQVKQEVK